MQDGQPHLARQATPRLGIQEGEIRSRIAAGDWLRQVFIVSVTVKGQMEHLAFVRPSWHRHFLPICTWEMRAERPYRDIDRLLRLLREEFRYRGAIPVYLESDPRLAVYRAWQGRQAESRSTPTRPDASGRSPGGDEA